MLSKNLNDYILQVPNVIPHHLCDAILNEYRDCDLWQKSRVGSGDVNDRVRSCSIIGISYAEIMTSETRKNLDLEIFNCAGEAIRQYSQKYERVIINEDTGYDLLKYETGQFYTQHVDHHATNARTVSCSFHLNDDYEGGEFGFFDKDRIIKCNKGDAIMFPSNFLYPHEILPVTSGTRYSIITWFK